MGQPSPISNHTDHCTLGPRRTLGFRTSARLPCVPHTYSPGYFGSGPVVTLSHETPRGSTASFGSPLFSMARDVAAPQVTFIT